MGRNGRTSIVHSRLSKADEEVVREMFDALPQEVKRKVMEKLANS